MNAHFTRKEMRYDHRRRTRYNEIDNSSFYLAIHLESYPCKQNEMAYSTCRCNSWFDAGFVMAARQRDYNMSGHFTNPAMKYMGDKYYKACKYKGTFINCGPDFCCGCHRDSMKEKRNKLWYVRIWKWCIRRKRFWRLFK